MVFLSLNHVHVARTAVVFHVKLQLVLKSFTVFPSMIFDSPPGKVGDAGLPTAKTPVPSIQHQLKKAQE